MSYHNYVGLLEAKITFLYVTSINVLKQRVYYLRTFYTFSRSTVKGKPKNIEFNNYYWCTDICTNQQNHSIRTPSAASLVVSPPPSTGYIHSQKSLWHNSYNVILEKSAFNWELLPFHYQLLFLSHNRVLIGLFIDL